MIRDLHNRHPIEILTEEFLERYRRGERPLISEYQKRYPELAEQIANVFPALDWLERAAPDSVSSESSALNSGTRPPDCLGDFRILREIGRGGRVVYEAEQISLGSSCCPEDSAAGRGA